MKKTIITILTMIAVHTLSAIPSLINYQGRLTDPNGDALTGNKIMSVSIYDAATEGTSLYTEEVGSISLDSNGIYSFSFGTNQTALTSALQTTGEHWLELTVDGTSQTPRERILSVPFAQVAGSVTSSFSTYTNYVDYMSYYDGHVGNERDTGMYQTPFSRGNVTGNLALLTQIYLEPGSRLKGFGATVTGMDSDPKFASLHFYSGALAETIAEIEFENDGNVEVALNEIIRIDANYFLRANIGHAFGGNTPQIGPIYFIYESNH